MDFIKDLDTPLLRISPQGDTFTLRNGSDGVHIFGGIGSGKTSGSGQMIAGAYLRAGFGGLVTAVKPEEIELWRRYAARHGRSKSLVLFGENEGFNFLSYELSRQGMNGIGTVTECLMRVVEAAKKASPTASQRGGEAFWEESCRMLLRYSILPIYAALGSLSFADIIRFVSSAPSHPKEPKDKDWQARSFMYSVINKAANNPKLPIPERALKNTIDYWSTRWPAVPEKTKGNIVVTIEAVLDRFLHGRLERAFCGRTTVVPELSFHGAIILLAMPTLSWQEDGIIAQQLFKFMWQRAVLGRNELAEKHKERPVFLWSDEAQVTANSYDGEFLSMCRGSNCCMTYLTQSLPNYYSKMGGDNPRDAAHTLVGKFNTHIYHANACPDTNEYASRIIGKVVKRRKNGSNGTSQSVNLGMSAGNGESSGTSSNHGYSSSSSGGQGGNSSTSGGGGSNKGVSNNWGSTRGESTSENVSEGYSETLENAIEPGDFARVLKTGGKHNGNEVTGVWFQSSRVFKASDGNVMLGRFQQ